MPTALVNLINDLLYAQTDDGHGGILDEVQYIGLADYVRETYGVATWKRINNQVEATDGVFYLNQPIIGDLT